MWSVRACSYSRYTRPTRNSHIQSVSSQSVGEWLIRQQQQQQQQQPQGEEEIVELLLRLLLRLLLLLILGQGHFYLGPSYLY